MESSPERANKTVVFAANSSWNLINFRASIIRGVQNEGYRVLAAVPDDEFARALGAMGIEVHHVPVDARGVSPLRDALLAIRYYRVLRELRPAAFLGFTAKPNIYGSAAAAALGIPVINTVTGLGTSFLSSQALERLVSSLYRLGLRRSRRVFFHNSEDRDLFVARGLVEPAQASVVPGSGVDLYHFAPAPLPNAVDPPTFLFIGRLLRDKGAVEYAEAAAIVKKSKIARFQMLGSLEDDPKAAPRTLLEMLVRDGTIELLGTTNDVRPFIANADCIVLPSYREGLPRVILEASAMARPVIATDVPGCRQAVDNGVTGLLCESRSSASLAEAMIEMVQKSRRERAMMGARGREKAQREFSQKTVVSTYLETLREIA